MTLASASWLLLVLGKARESAGGHDHGGAELAIGLLRDPLRERAVRRHGREIDFRLLPLVGRCFVQADGDGDFLRRRSKVNVLSIWSRLWPASTVKRLTSATFAPSASQAS